MLILNFTINCHRFRQGEKNCTHNFFIFNISQVELHNILSRKMRKPEGNTKGGKGAHGGTVSIRIEGSWPLLHLHFLTPWAQNSSQDMLLQYTMHQSVKDCLDLEMAISSWPKGQHKPTNQRVINYQNKAWFHITPSSGQGLSARNREKKKNLRQRCSYIPSLNLC